MKAAALRNMFHMLVARAVFHAPMFWLKAVALWNRLAMFVTLAVFHAPMLPLNVGLFMNSWYMLVTAAVFQSAMLPYVAVAVAGFVAHAVTAVPMLPSTRHALLSPLHVGYAVRSVAPHSR